MELTTQLKKFEWVLNGMLLGRKQILTWNFIQGENITNIEIIIDEAITLTMNTHVFETHVRRCKVFDITANDWVSACMDHITNEFSCIKCHAARIISRNLCSNCMLIEHNSFETSDDCGVCLDKNTTRSCKLICGHIFHQACVSAILKRQNNTILRCPNCRSDQIVTYSANKGYVFTRALKIDDELYSDESDSDEHYPPQIARSLNVLADAATRALLADAETHALLADAESRALLVDARRIANVLREDSEALRVDAEALRVGAEALWVDARQDEAVSE